MFQNFTAEAQRILTLSQAEATSLHMRIVEIEHILLSIIKDKDLNNGKKVLLLLETDLKNLQSEIEKDFIQSQNHTSDFNIVEFSAETKRVIELAIDESKKLNDDKIGGEHILLGLLRSSETKLPELLSHYNVTLNLVRETVKKGLEQYKFINVDQSDKQMQFQQVQQIHSIFFPTPFLDRFGKDLSKRAQQGKIDPVIGRSQEIERAMEILTRRSKNNPILIGEPGVGKTAIAEGLALNIFQGNVPEKMKHKRIILLELGTLVAGTHFRGEFEQRLTGIVNEVQQTGNIILFIDEIHMLGETGNAIGGTGAGEILKPALARGDLQCIGATTTKEYRKYFLKDAALGRRFQPITINEPTVEESILILKGLIPLYSAFHGVEYTEESIIQAVKLSKRYITDRFLPDKAIDLMDEAGAKLNLRAAKPSTVLEDLENEKKVLEDEKNKALTNIDFSAATSLHQKMLVVEQKINDELLYQQNQFSQNMVDDNLIAQIVSQWTGIPVEKNNKEQIKKVLNLESTLRKKVIGQKYAIEVISKAMRRAKSGMKDPNRPIGSFLFLGPTGVGKTELARMLALEMFGDRDAMIRIDMSEYMEKHNVTRLIGSAPGFVGYDEGGQLTEKVLKKPFSIVLFDEIEKGHPDVFDLLLQILEDGRLTDGQGTLVDFRNTIIIMTSNIGSSKLFSNKRLGFSSSDESEEIEHIKTSVMEELTKHFRAEFINRIDYKDVIFLPLSKEEVLQIAHLIFDDIARRIEEMKITISMTEEGFLQVAEEGYDKKFGARPLRRAMQDRIEDLLSDALLKEEIVQGDKILIDYQNGEFFLSHTHTLSPVL